MKRPFQRHAGAIAPLLLFVIFTTCILSVLLTGADVLRSLSRRDQDSFQQRTCAQYLTTKVRQNDVASQIFVADFSHISDTVSVSDSSLSEDGAIFTGDTLFLQEELGGRTYYTRIYCWDGHLRELFSQADLTFAPSDGQEILNVQDLTFTKQGSSLTIHITYPDGSTETLRLHLRSGEEAAS